MKKITLMIFSLFLSVMLFAQKSETAVTKEQSVQTEKVKKKFIKPKRIEKGDVKMKDEKIKDEKHDMDKKEGNDDKTKMIRKGNPKYKKNVKVKKDKDPNENAEEHRWKNGKHKGDKNAQ